MEWISLFYRPKSKNNTAAHNCMVNHPPLVTKRGCGEEIDLHTVSHMLLFSIQLSIQLPHQYNRPLTISLGDGLKNKTIGATESDSESNVLSSINILSYHL